MSPIHVKNIFNIFEKIRDNLSIYETKHAGSFEITQHFYHQINKSKL